MTLLWKRQNVASGRCFTDKDRKYQVIAVAYHTKSNEKMIVYQQLFDNFKILTDTFDDFLISLRQKYILKFLRMTEKTMMLTPKRI